MRKALLICAVLLSTISAAQVDIGSLSLKGRIQKGDFQHTAECFTDTLLLSHVDPGTAGGFSYSYTFFKTDSNLGKQNVILNMTGGWPVDLAAIGQGLDFIKTQSEPLLLLRIVVRNNNSSDSAFLPILVKSVPEPDTAYLSIFGRMVFNQDNYVPFSNSFPGPWVGHNMVLTGLYFKHGYFDYFRMKLEELDSSGSKIRNVEFAAPFNDTTHLHIALPEFAGFNIAGWPLDSNDRFTYNTQREYYRFTYYYGVKGCDYDSLYTYMRVIDPAEFSLTEPGKGGVEIFPNPVSTGFTLAGNSDFEEIAIYNSAGELVLSRKLEASEEERYFKMESYPAGIYTIVANPNDVSSASLKIMKL